MKTSKYFTVFCMGFFGLLAQALLFRTFLIAFDGNELSIGLFFFSWLIWVCIGAWIAKRQTIAKLAKYFYILIILYLPLYIIQQYLFINAHSIIGGYSFELVPLDQLIPFVLLFNAPISFMTGFLFVLGADWMRKSSVPVIKIYICESFGSFIGALMVTLLLFMGYIEESIFLVAAFIVLLSTLPHTFSPSIRIINRVFRIIIPTLIIIVLFILFNNYTAKWNNHNNRREWQNFIQHGKYLGSFLTPQAKYLYGTYKGEFIVTAWNSTYESLPNTENSSITAGEYLSQNPTAKKILVAGPGSFSICRTFSKLPQIRKIVWLNTDPDYPKHFLKILPAEYKKNIAKIEIPGCDVRKYIQNTNTKFDLVVLNIPNPSTLLLNKYFSFEFFKHLEKVISSNGVIGINFPAGANYMGTELSFMGSSLLYTLQQVYHYIVLKPGDASCFFAAKESGIVSGSGIVLQKRLAAVKGITKIFNPENISSFFEKNRIHFQMKKYEEIIKKYPHKLFFNTDKNPKAFLYTLLFTAKKLGDVGFSISGLNTILQIVFPYTILLILIYFILRFFYYFCYGLKNSKEKKISKKPNYGLHNAELYTAVFAAAISGLGINLILIFLFQIYFGSVFLYFGLITALFMLGLFISGLVVEKLLHVFQCRSVLNFTALIYLLYILLIYFNPPEHSMTYFAILFLYAGLFSGPFFALTAFNLKQQAIPEIRSGARLEIIDNFGGAIGSILCSIVLLPIIGINKTLTVMFIFWGIILLHSIFLRGRTAKKISKLTHTIRIIGFSMVGIVLIFIFIPTLHKNKEKNIGQAAWKLTKAQVHNLAVDHYHLIQENKKIDGRPCTYYVVKDKNQTMGYIFRTKDFSKDIMGFAGPIHMLSYVSSDGKIQNFTVLESNETPSYLNEILKSKKIFLGQNVLNNQEKYQINAITGATITSSTISKILLDTGSNFSTKILGNKSQQPKLGIRLRASGLRHQVKILKEAYSLLPLLLLILFTIIAIILRKVNSSRWGRYCFLSAVFIVLGIMFNLQYSIDQVYSLISFKFYLSYFNSFLFLCIGVPILIMIFGNIYCGYLCPFGAFQELLYLIFYSFFKKIGIISTHPKLNETVWKLGRTIKYIILFILVIIFISVQNKAIAEKTDILQHVFSFFFSANLTLYFIISLVFISLFYKRFWCRVLCPSGAFLALFNAVKLMRNKNKIQIQNCDLGVYNKKDFDCICCDNCRKSKKPEPTKKNQISKLYNYFFIFFAIVCFYYILLLLHQDYNVVKGLNNNNIGTIRQSKNIQKKQTIKAITFLANVPAIKSIGTPRNIDIQKYNNYINKGRLSSHPAMYYKKLQNRSQRSTKEETNYDKN